MRCFNLPDLGEGLQEAELIAWHVSVGDHVVADQPLASVETDKAVVEIPSPMTGAIAKLHGAPGDILKVDEPLVDFGELEETDSATVVGKLPEGEKKKAFKASPAARRRARELGITLASLSGSGPGGMISLEDVEKEADNKGEALTGQDLRGVRRAMARNMARAHREVVPATVTDCANISAWEADQDITLRLVRAVAKGVEASPALNAWYLPQEERRVLHDHIDLGIAVDSEDGLFVPVLRDISNRSPENIRKGIEAMKADIQRRTIPLAELRGQTITLSNFGMFGGRYAALVVLPPQVAIIGAGRIHEAVAPSPAGPVTARVLPISITFDHRVVMGGEATHFLNAALRDLEMAR